MKIQPYQMGCKEKHFKCIFLILLPVFCWFVNFQSKLYFFGAQRENKEEIYVLGTWPPCEKDVLS